MALIGTIRKNSWLLVVLIALGMGGFVLQDILTSNSRYSAGNSRTMGKVNGIVIDAMEFSETEAVLYGNSNTDNIYSNKANLWNYFKNKALAAWPRLRQTATKKISRERLSAARSSYTPRGESGARECRLAMLSILIFCMIHSTNKLTSFTDCIGKLFPNSF